MKLVDQVSTPLAKIQTGLTSFRGIAETAVAGFSLAVLFHKVADESIEAEKNLTQFNLTVKNLGTISGEAQKEMVEYSKKVQQSLAFSDDAVLKAQTTMLRFSSLSGDAFKRARADALDLSTALGIDLESAATVVARALERPTIGLRQLRAIGIIFSAEQQNVIKNLEETGKKAEAQDLILGELEKRYRGAAETAANTLGGALKKLKNNFDDLFEADEGKAAPLVNAINGITKALQDPKLKEGIANIIQGILLIAQTAANAAATLGRLGDTLGKVFVNYFMSNAPDKNGVVGALTKELELEKIKLNRMKASGLSTDDDEVKQEAYIATLKERIKLAQQLVLTQQRDADLANQRKKLFDSLTEYHTGATLRGSPKDKKEKAAKDVAEAAPDYGTGSPAWREGMAFAEMISKNEQLLANSTIDKKEYADRLADHFEKAFKDIKIFEPVKAELDRMVEAGRISAEQAGKVINEALDEQLKEVKVTARKIGEAGPVNEVGQAIVGFKNLVTGAFEDMVNTGKLSMRELTRYIIAELTKKAIASAIQSIGDAFSNMLSGVTGKGKGGFFGTLLSGIGKVFGFAAGGGDIRGATVVGEEGPEVVIGKGRVYNKRQLAALGGGQSLVFSPTNYMTVQTTGDPREAQAAFAMMLDQRDRNMMRSINALMRDNGVRLR